MRFPIANRNTSGLAASEHVRAIEAAATQAALTAGLAAKQDLNAKLTALGGVTGAADKLAYFTGASTMTVADLTSFMRTVLDDTDAPTARATLGVAWEQIASAPMTGLSAADFALPTGYKAFRFIGSELSINVNGDTMRIDYSTNGSTYTPTSAFATVNAANIVFFDFTIVGHRSSNVMTTFGSLMSPSLSHVSASYAASVQAVRLATSGQYDGGVATLWGMK